MSVSHTHWCKHCDCNATCNLDNCIFSYEVSKFHDCGERQKANDRFKRIMADYQPCKFGCKALPCIHNKWPEKVKPEKRYFQQQQESFRPRIINYQGKQLILASENLHTIANKPAYVESSEDTMTTRYVSDGNNFDYAMQVQRKWIKNKVDAIASSFPEHLQSLVKEMRGTK